MYLPHQVDSAARIAGRSASWKAVVRALASVFFAAALAKLTSSK